jgi:hypothetical protein
VKTEAIIHIRTTCKREGRVFTVGFSFQSMIKYKKDNNSFGVQSTISVKRMIFE